MINKIAGKKGDIGFVEGIITNMNIHKCEYCSKYLNDN